MNRYAVTVPLLNVRSTPTSTDSFNILGRIPLQTVVEILNNSDPYWWEIKTIFTNLSGYVAARYLEPVTDNPILVNSISKTDYANDARASLFSKEMMHKPIGTPIIEYRDLSDSEAKRRSIQYLIATLDVSRNVRHRRTERHTFCNIYAYDFCHFCSTYIPRVWWNSKAIKSLQAGENVELLYGETVNELNANALHDWFLEWGDDFGWTRMSHAEDIQNAVNANGGVGIICAKRKDRNKFGSHYRCGSRN